MPCDVLYQTPTRYEPGRPLTVGFQPNSSGMSAPVVPLAVRVKNAGLLFSLDFHYSDTWADPGHQSIPNAWTNLNFTQLVQEMRTYNSNTIAAWNHTGEACASCTFSTQAIVTTYDLPYEAAPHDTMLDKNHDYGEAWRDMSQESFVDLILMKILRVRQIVANNGATLISEGIDSNFIDIINYSLFALVLIGEGKHSG